MEGLIGALSGIDPKALWIAAGIIAIMGIISLLKRAIKIGIIIIVISLIITYGGSLVDSLREKYQFEYTGDAISIVVDGEKKEIKLDKIKELKVVETYNNVVELEIIDEDGNVNKVKVIKALYEQLLKDKDTE